MAPKAKTPEIPKFQVGSLVEISSDDDGFRGSWYTGTIVRKISNKKYTVEYKEIFEDASGTKPLRENFDVFQLRPLAPREKQRTFNTDEEVDAYHNDGWWEGVITEDHGDGRFSVYFRHSKEQLVMEEKDLRLHREWVNGVWSPPLAGEENRQSATVEKPNKEAKQENSELREDRSGTEVRPRQNLDSQNLQLTKGEKPNKAAKQENSGLCEDSSSAEVKRRRIQVPEEYVFSEGTPIEVCSDDDGFEGAWFAATIVKVSGKNKYLIEYQSLKAEDDGGFLREETDILHIRPVPPEAVMVDSFNILDEVDAFYTDGWWVGVIAKLLTDSRYLVFFKDTDEELVFKHSDLRPHQDWINGEWIFRRRF